MRKSCEKWEKMGKSGKKLEKWEKLGKKGESSEKWLTVRKSGEKRQSDKKLGKVGKSGHFGFRFLPKSIGTSLYSMSVLHVSNMKLIGAFLIKL